MTGINHTGFPGKSTDTFTVTLSYKSNLDTKDVLINGNSEKIEIVKRSIWNRIAIFFGLTKTYKYKVKPL